jgi:ABC-type tungstate transport system permease subunit
MKARPLPLWSLIQGIEMKCRSLALAAILLLLLIPAGFAQERSIVVASTTSTEQSGLFVFLLPRFSAKTSIQVKVLFGDGNDGITERERDLRKR